MAANHPDQHLLFGIIAMQMDFISREQLIAATSRWLEDKSRSMNEILLDQGALSDSDHESLSRLLESHLSGSPDDSLPDLQGLESTAKAIQSMDSSQLEATLTMVGWQGGGSGVRTHGPGSWDGSRFRVLRAHAKGGLGVVSVAEDMELHREVALKEIQPGFTGDQSSRNRFVMEAEITGRLEHPGIVPVYGLGRRSDGNPYYAMKFIRGDSLQDATKDFYSKFADSIPYESMEFRKLLGRFIDTCEAIEYAHSRGVLHRDLKPDNVMLGKYGETLVVDWGLAKVNGVTDNIGIKGEPILHISSDTKADQTREGSVIGTPAYMPPEQATGRLEQLGPASDVYSLGAILYFLLTGRRPFQEQTIKEILKKVEVGDFPAPKMLRKSVPKALESICLRAMATKPEERYTSPRELAEDVERFLADDPVLAHAEPLPARSRRWIRKHPRTVATVAATLLIGFTSTIVVASIVAGKNRELASVNSDLDHANTQLTKSNVELAAANTKERRATVVALQSRQEYENVLNFVETRILSTARPKDENGGLGIDVTVREALNAAEPLVMASFVEHPVAEARVRLTLGQSYIQLGDYEKSMSQFDRARELWELVGGPGDPNALEATCRLIDAMMLAGQYNEALRITEGLLQNVKSESLPPTWMTTFANLYGKAGRKEDALKWAEMAYRKTVSADAIGARHDNALKILGNWAHACLDADRTQTAASLYEQARNTATDALGPNHPTTLALTQGLATTLSELDRVADALPLYESVLDSSVKTLGIDHPNTLITMENLGRSYMDVDRTEDGLRLLEQASDHRRRTMPTDHPDTIAGIAHLADAYREHGQLDKALKLFAECTKLKEQRFGPLHPKTLLQMGNEAHVLWMMKRPEEAIPRYQRALKLSTQALGENHKDTMMLKSNLIVNLKDAGRLEQAVVLQDEVLRQQKELLGPSHRSTLQTMTGLGYTCKELGQIDRAKSLFERAFELSRDEHGPDDPDTLSAQYRLGSQLNTYEPGQRSIDLHTDLVERRRRVLGPHARETLSAMNNLGLAHEKNVDYTNAIKQYRLTISEKKRGLGETDKGLIVTLGNLARVVLRSSKELDLAELEYLPTLANEIAALSSSLASDDSSSRVKLASASWSIGTAQFKNGRLDDAINSFQHTIAIDRNSTQGRNSLSGVLQSKYEYSKDPVDDQAREEVDRELIEMIEAKPEEKRTPNGWGYLGQAAYRTGQWDKARTALAKVNELRGDSGPTLEGGPRWWYLAMTLARLGDIEQARKIEHQLIALVKEADSSDQFDKIQAKCKQVLEEAQAASDR